MKTYTETNFINYPDLNKEVLRNDIKQIKLLRAWYIFRAYDYSRNNGSGCFPQTVALEILSSVLNTRKSYNYAVLKEGNGIFWTISRHEDGQKYIHYHGTYKMARTYGIPRYSEQNTLLIEDVLLGDVCQVRANLYKTAIGKNSSYTPLARQTINKYYGLSISTQRKYETVGDVEIEKMGSYIVYATTKNLQEAAIAKKELMAHEDINPHAIKIKRQKGAILVLYQRGNLYSTVGVPAQYPSTIKKCNNRLKKKRQQDYLNEVLLATSDHNDERLAGVISQRDVRLYHLNSKKCSNNMNFFLKKDGYSYMGITQLSKAPACYKGGGKEDACLYAPSYCHATSPFKAHFHTSNTQ